MADLNARVPMTRITRDITMNIEVTGVRVWRVRMWLAVKIMRLAAWVAGVGIKIET